IPMVALAQPETQDSTRYGPFDLFDSRSKYNTNHFPEPLLADEMDADQEVRLNWLHTEKQSHRVDDASFEVEKNVGLLTVEFEIPYEREVEDGDTAEGVGSIELSARHPFYQYVSPSGAF